MWFPFPSGSTFQKAIIIQGSAMMQELVKESAHDSFAKITQGHHPSRFKQSPATQHQPHKVSYPTFASQSQLSHKMALVAETTKLKDFTMRCTDHVT